MASSLLNEYSGQTRDLAAAIIGIAFFDRRYLAQIDVGPPPKKCATNVFFSPLILSYLNIRQQIGIFGANNRILRFQHWTDKPFFACKSTGNKPDGESRQGGVGYPQAQICGQRASPERKEHRQKFNPQKYSEQ